jgi:hypothetical protein
MKYIHFYATRGDMLPVLEAVERDGPLQYVRTGNELSPDFETFLHGADIPNLGTADRETGSGCKAFLVTTTAVPITVRSRPGIGGVERYYMDQLVNPDTVCFTPAGIWGDDFVLNGRVATISDTPVPRDIMKRFYSAIRKRFTKVRAFWVGPEALALLGAGKRLTIAAQSPREFDLRPGPPEPPTVVEFRGEKRELL